jgi:hypothetical protein
MNIKVLCVCAAVPFLFAMAPASHLPKARIMTSPPISADQYERVLSSSEITGLPCNEAARSVAATYPNVVWSSERVSQSNQFGYVYRYDMVNQIDGEDVRSMLLLWTKNNKTFRLATYSLADLPGELR